MRVHSTLADAYRDLLLTEEPVRIADLFTLGNRRKQVQDYAM